METDVIIKQQIEKALESNILLHGTKIGVAVENSEVILTGYADRYYKKDIAGKIAKEVQGVNLVDEKILIVLDDSEKSSDKEIEANIIEKFRKNFGNAQKDIKITVRDGYVWLEGRLKWKYQKDLAEKYILYITGIKGIDNNIFVPEMPEPEINEKDVFAAIYGDHSITSDIKIEVLGHRIILKGRVESVEQKDLVTQLVRNVPGVTEIENFLSVDWMC